jgi:YfiH family protein
VTLPEPFRREGEHVAIDLPGARALFTTRRGGVSTGPYESLNLGLWTDDDPAAVAENRRRAAVLAGGPALAQGRQVHGAVVNRVAGDARAGDHPAGDAPAGDARAGDPLEADGQATALDGVAPIALVADCLPVALAGEGAVAMLHCGWRGLAAGILAEGVRAVRELGATGPLAAAIGPGAGRCCYEVGDEVHATFADLGPDVRAGRNLDLKAIARIQLTHAGVEEIHDPELCTMCADPRLFFSHRRDQGTTGRQGGIIQRQRGRPAGAPRWRKSTPDRPPFMRLKPSDG